MAKHMQKRPRKAVNLTPPPLRQSYPAVSVIIPMYNTEKYIGDCLESLLAQTFQNFEVIVVNNCSTDTSSAIVESYIPKFGGRLKFSHREKNSGSSAVPRNEGLMLSRGKYAFFVDSDDTLTKYALEKLYSTMENFDVDLIFCTRNYTMNEYGSDIKETRIPIDRFEGKTVLYDNFTKRIEDIAQNKFYREPWRSFSRRDFLIENKLFFPFVGAGEDVIWFYALFFYAKRILFLTEPVYFYRIVSNSIMHTKRPPKQFVPYWLNPVILGIETLDKQLSKLEFFKQNYQYKYVVLEVFATGYFNRIFESSLQLPPSTVYETIKQEFGDNLGEQDVLVSALCTIINTQQRMAAINQQRFNQFAAQAQEQVKKFNEFAAQAQRRIAELEAQLKTK